MSENGGTRYALMALAPMVGGILVFSALYFYTGETAPSEVMFQDFEEGNGTPGAYFWDVWQGSSMFEASTVHGGERSVRMTAGENGGTIAIAAAFPSGYVDMSNATSFSIWVYDTVGNNTVQLRLKDADGDGGSGEDGYYLWSSDSSVQDQWTKITWDLSLYPSVPNLDWDRISSIELFEHHSGTYYFDDSNFVRLS